MTDVFDRTSALMKCLVPAIPIALLTACGIDTQTTAPSVGSPKTVIRADGITLPTIDRDGTYLVGFLYGDVQVGRYRNSGGTMCYWARLRSLEPDDVIESKKTTSPQEVHLQAGDTAFLTRNCGTWQFVSVF